MHRLFWKIFLSFWISLVLFSGTILLAASVYLEHQRAQDATENPRFRHRGYVEEARFIADNDGIDGLKKWLRDLDRSEAIPYYLIDSEGTDLLGRPVSPHLTHRLASRGPRPHSDKAGRFPRHRGRVHLPGVGDYRLVADFRALTLNRVLSRPRVILFPIVAAAVVSALVCFLLAGYLTRPIQRLSRATHQYAAGDLSLRVAPAMGGRRDEVANLARDFDHMAERLQSLLSAHEQLLRDVSHELRSPLARLQVALGIARQREKGQPDIVLERIEREAENLNELIGQLLSLTRLETGVALSHAEDIDLAGLLEEVTENADFEAQVRNRRVHMLNSMPATVEANGNLLRSALENVIRNAAWHTRENTSVDVSLELDPTRDSWLMIEVLDHGLGVPEEMLARLFEPFVRVDDSRVRDSGGYGLGLAIAERAIRLHGGEIAACNAPDGGLLLSIQLPLTQAL